MKLADLRPRDRATRSQDITSGLLNVDQTSAPVVQLRATRITGWSASLSATLREQEVEDLNSLQLVAAQHFGIEGFAFDSVLRNLQEAGIASVQRRRDREVLYVEQLALGDLYQRLGERFEAQRPSEFDVATLAVVETLAATPMRSSRLISSLGLDPETLAMIRGLGEDAQLIKVIDDVPGDPLLHSPLFTLERPDQLARIFNGADDEELVAGFKQIRSYQGLPLEQAPAAMQAAVKRGLLTAPTVRGVSGEHAFLSLPPAPPAGVERVVAEKAMAILAAVRYGQHHGRRFKIKWPELVLEKLGDARRSYMLNPHPELATQYQALASMGIVRLVPSSNMYAAQLIPTEDNRRALRIALDLIRYGEPLDQRAQAQPEIEALLRSSQQYRGTLWTMKHQKVQARMSDKTFTKLLVSVQGGAPLDV